MAESKDNSGALFKNLKKVESGNSSWPDYQGSITVNGSEFWLSAWLKDSKDGKKYMSLALKPKEVSATNTPSSSSKPHRSQPEREMDDEGVPF